MMRHMKIIVALAAIACCVGCDRSNGVNPKEGASDTTNHDTADKDKRVLAIVGSHKITYEDFVEELNSLEPYVRMRFSSLERKQALLKQLVDQELLAQEACRQGLATSPAVVAQVERALADAYLEQLKYKLVHLESITDADVRSYYDHHATEYDQPFSQVRSRIRNQLLEKRRIAEVRRYVKTLRQKATIETFPQNAAALFRKPHHDRNNADASTDAAEDAATESDATRN